MIIAFTHGLSHFFEVHNRALTKVMATAPIFVPLHPAPPPPLPSIPVI